MSKNKTQDLDNFLQLCHKAQELIFENYLIQGVYIDDFVNDCTPIEQIFYIANDINSQTNKRSCELCPQSEIEAGEKTYYADFAVFLVGFDTVDDDIVEVYLKRPLIIELDGQDYHSSKQQRNKDYKRENDLKLAGYDIMRFTGSQVYNDVYGCLEQVYQYIDKADKVVWNRKTGKSTTVGGNE